MPIKIQSDLPVKEILEQENIFVMDDTRAMHQDIRPIQILILNLMPLKEETELQLLRSLSNTPLQIDVTFMAVASHEAKNTSRSHLNKFYISFEQVKEQKFDGMIITGAPVEQMEFEEVDYWEELTEIMEWSKSHVTSTIHLCWGAQAGLYYHYGLKKRQLSKKMFGLFWHEVQNRKIPLVRGFDDLFLAPHSRHTEVSAEDIHNCKALTVLAESREAGVILEDNVEVGINSSIDRGALDDTVIGKGTKIDNVIQIGHNCKIGKNCILAAMSGVAGSTIVEDWVLIGAAAGVSGHLKIGAGSQIGAGAGVIQSLPPKSVE